MATLTLTYLSCVSRQRKGGAVNNKGYNHADWNPYWNCAIFLGMMNIFFLLLIYSYSRLMGILYSHSHTFFVVFSFLTFFGVNFFVVFLFSNFFVFFSCWV